VVKLLLNDERVNPSGYNNYAIRYASENGHVDVVKLLLNDKRVDPGAQQQYALVSAARKGHMKVVKALLDDRRVAPEATSKHGAYSIAFVSTEQCPEGIKFLRLKDSRFKVDITNEEAPCLLTGAETKNLMEAWKHDNVGEIGDVDLKQLELCHLNVLLLRFVGCPNLQNHIRSFHLKLVKEKISEWFKSTKWTEFKQWLESSKLLDANKWLESQEWYEYSKWLVSEEKLVPFLDALDYVSMDDLWNCVREFLRFTGSVSTAGGSDFDFFALPPDMQVMLVRSILASHKKLAAAQGN
jgi:hypothetical protein